MCKTNIEQRCIGRKNDSACITYLKELPTISKITDTCYNVEQIIKDLYCLLQEQKDEIELLKERITESENNGL